WSESIRASPSRTAATERMHRTLKAETSRPPAATEAEQQLRFDHFRRYFNRQRPHEALGQTPPAEHYVASQRRYPNQLGDPWYDADYQLLRVRADGCVKWGGKLIYISEALGGEFIGIAEIDSGQWLVGFADIELGIVDESRPGKLRRHGLEQLRLHPVTN